jgi:uncharacterized circularly permuted ATP-grasp superfamily protein/uncharacterized alpha-E superfamily protein
LFHSYKTPAGVYDEVFATPERVRPHWQTIVRTLDTLGAQELMHRWDEARRMLYEHGVTYNVHDQQQGFERPWQLDAVPFVLDAPEWAALETALSQRARLLNALLADVYGPQTLLTRGLLPPELLFAHPGFLRPCHGIRLPGGHYLHFYAADLARSPDGQWWVAADRAQSPAGAGYALENRRILARTLSDVLRQSHVQRLPAFFETFHQTLCDLAPRHRDNPRIVLLTPGPASNTYFEHVYLARFLGYTLVQGADLTVRDHSVFLKTLAGLQPVDVILRRQDDVFCDPLGLRQDSVLGTAGLIQAVRAGNVVVANALGSGWLETTALLPFLPVLCQHVLGEALKLASVPTWWCGQPDALAYVLEHGEDLHLVPAFPAPAPSGRPRWHFHPAARRRLLTLLRAQPYAFAAQQPPPLSTVPVWSQRGMQCGSLLLRVYLAATADGYVMLPGGLTRVAADASTSVQSVQWGDGSKDTWVLSARPVHLSHQTAQAPSVTLRRSGYDLPSRVADDLLWLGRYAERAEGASRLLRSTVQRLTDDEAGTGSYSALPTVLQALSDHWHLDYSAMLEGLRTSPNTLEQALWTLLYDGQTPDSVRALLKMLHQVATRVRDRISVDAWRILAHLEQRGQQPAPPRLMPASATLAWLNDTLMTLAAFSGLGMENMTRGPGWSFLDMGRRLERAMHMVRVLASTLGQVATDDGVVLEAVLEIADSSMTYRSRYLTTLQFTPVLDLLLSDETNPRSVAFQLLALAEHVEHLPRDITDPSLSPTQRLTLTVLSTVQLAEITTLCDIDRSGQRPHLVALLAHLTQALPALAETLTHQYLSHAEPARHLATAGRAEVS